MLVLKKNRNFSKVITYNFSEKKNQKGIFNKIKDLLYATINGTKKFYKDIKFANELLKNKTLYSENYTPFELSEMRRIKIDTFKMIPFSFFAFIPMTEIFLPVYIMLFPNSYPSQYQTPEKVEKKLKNSLEKQRLAHPELLKQLNYSLIANNADITRILEKSEMKKLLIEHQKFLDQELNIKKFDSDSLILVSEFLGMQCVTGTHILSVVFTHSINLPRYCLVAFMYIIGRNYKIMSKHWIFNYE